jgi:thiamine transport system permease protein
MAPRAKPLTLMHWIGAAIAALIFALVIGALGALAWRAEGASGLGPADWSAIRFTVFQAALSAILSVVCAIPVARALARRNFHGRGMLITLMGAPFILPVIVAVLGLLAVFGRNGAVSVVLGWLGLAPLEIYGLHGILLAHVFFNMPLAVRLILQGWLSIPAERFRLAASLGFRGRDVSRHLEWPMLRAIVPGALLVIFLICTTSFAVALTLGGGPRSTTVELAIYQAFRFEFDLGRAALLGIVECVICAVAVLLSLRFALPQMIGAGLDRRVERHDVQGGMVRALDIAVICIAAVFLIAPLIAVISRGAGEMFTLPPVIWDAALRSVILALSSAALAIGLALPFALLMARGRQRAILEGIGVLTIAVSPLVLGTGLFLMIFPVANPVALALPITGLVNAVVALPFILRALVPAIELAEASHGRLADSLGLTQSQRLRHVLLPRLRRPLGFGAGLAAAFSMGDLGVIALFSAPQSGTLPMEMFRLMGAYRMAESQGAAVLLLALSLVLFWSFDRGGRINAAT